MNTEIQAPDTFLRPRQQPFVRRASDHEQTPSQLARINRLAWKETQHRADFDSQDSLRKAGVIAQRKFLWPLAILVIGAAGIVETAAKYFGWW